MPEPGDLLGPYRLISQLGKGAMGEVWRARDQRLDRYVALKVLPPDQAGDPERRHRMLREARAAAQVGHPNVVTLYDIITHGDEDILVMELVEGRTLSDLLRSQRPPLDRALTWLAALTDALAAAHAKGILHRDIKSANVMLANDGTLKVLDFGLAKLREPSGGERRIEVAPSLPAASSSTRIALDATMPSAPDAYATAAGSLLGTPLYMAPEQIAGDPPDERSEVFSVGVLAYELLAGKPPYTATTLDDLFTQILKHDPPPLDTPLWPVLARALAKDPTARTPTMRALHDELAAERHRLFAPPARRWPLAAAATLLALAAAGTAYYVHAHRPAPPRPGDEYVARALEEYNVFYNDKAMSSLRAALAIAPEHPRANAYIVLFGTASDDDRAAAVTALARARTEPHSKDRALVDAASALATHGAAAAREALLAAGATSDRELAFWLAELDYRAGHYALARDEYRALLAAPAEAFRGRIYDHDSAVLLYFDEPTEALRVGKLYRDAFPGEPDAVAVHATTLAAAGRFDDATTAAEEALRLSEGEDTLAGLAKVLALRGDHAKAKELYARSLDKAGPSRRPVRRAALAFLQWIDGDAATARTTVAPCLPGGADALAHERGPCLFVAGVLDPTGRAAAQLDALAAEATDLHPAYGNPTALAALVRARAHFFGGACVTTPDPSLDGAVDAAAYDQPLDFFAAYHIPFFATWAVCEHAALLAARGDKRRAVELLRSVTDKAPNRAWLRAALASLQR
ncbi:MAG: serine/threonine protein kinase [Deltaproteobacteria bacterium]|nr:serine/threonine protein kinase [Deltaproteobacteria bacterium]